MIILYLYGYMFMFSVQPLVFLTEVFEFELQAMSKLLLT